MAPRPDRKKGRPPAGKRPGEFSSQYPRFALRLPASAHDRLQALARISVRPQWRVIADAIDAYVRQMPADQQALLAALLARAEPLLAQPVRTHSPEPASVFTVLNVDDDESMRFARTAMLRQDGLRVIEAATGRAALKALESCDARVVVLDVNLPDMSGLEVCRQIKGDERWQHIRVVQTSATFSTPHDQLQGLEEGGADIYLAEPVPRGTLLSIIRRLAAQAPSRN